MPKRKPDTLRLIEDSALNRSDRALLRCELARELEEAGDYAGAERALGELWAGVGRRPSVDGLDEKTLPLVLLRAGALTGWLGTARQIGGAQEAAKDFISESIRRFEELRMTTRVAEARAEMALCYWREGAVDEARIVMRDALALLDECGGDARHGELCARVLLRSATFANQAQRFERARQFLARAEPLVGASDSEVLKGKFHGELARTLRNLATREGREDYMDRALVEYAATNYHFERAGHLSYWARSENNLSFLFLTLGRYAEAHEHLDRAQGLFRRLRDEGSLAQSYETRARIFLAEGENAKAERAARDAVEILSKGSERALLAEALAAQGVALARLGRDAQARARLEEAIGAAEGAGDPEVAGRAALSLVEELGERLPFEEVCVLYGRADGLLGGVDQPETVARLRACARLALARARGLQDGGRGFAAPTGAEDETGAGVPAGSLPEAVRRYEARLIGRALDESGGSVTAAARRLGISHQTLSAILRRRHQGFLAKQKPRKRRQVSIIRRGAARAGKNT